MATEKSVMAVIRASRPSFRNDHDKVAFVVHASFLTAGYVLTATGPPAFAEDCNACDEVGIEGWNEVEDQYAFVYINPEKDNKILVKCLVMGNKLMVDALSDGASESVHLDINVDECVTETGAGDYNAQYKNLGTLVCSLEADVLSKLDGGSDGNKLRGPTSSHASEEGNFFVDGPKSLQDPPSRYIVPPVNPVGGSDLFPSGGAGMYPSRGGFGDGSMLVGPQDQRWFGGGGAFPDIPGGPGGLGGVPPGARFDPYGPPGVPGFEPGRFGRFPRGRNPGSGTHPDLQPGGGGSDFI